MFLSEVEIENYRTFGHVVLHLDPRVNYMVGDSRIGKSNFLALLHTILSGHGFSETDFLDASLPIQVWLTFSGVESQNPVKIFLSQHVRQVVPRLSFAETGEDIPIEEIRKVTYFPYHMEKALDQSSLPSDLSLLCECFSIALSGPVAERAEWETLFRKSGIPIDLSGGSEEAALRVLQKIYGPNPDTGVGLSDAQTMMAAGLYLLLELFKRKKSPAVPFSDMVLLHEDGKQYLPILLGIDEPEVRLHSFRQRSVVYFLHKLLHNEEPLFVRLLQRVLGIDGLSGQIFVVTHSTDALVDDYRKIIRLYWTADKKVAAACGERFRFSPEVEKQLIMHFPEVKEALFGRAAILVEGETEYGAFPFFAKSMGHSLDFHGICLINARGETSISRIAELMHRFHVPTVCLYDRDVAGGKKYAPNVFFTDHICFEMDVARHLLPQRRKALDRAIFEAGDGDEYVSGALIKKAAIKLNVMRSAYPPKLLSHVQEGDRGALYFYYFAWLFGNKGVITGRALGLSLSEGEIPTVFKKVITAAVTAARKK